MTCGTCGHDFGRCIHTNRVKPESGGELVDREMVTRLWGLRDVHMIRCADVAGGGYAEIRFDTPGEYGAVRIPFKQANTIPEYITRVLNSEHD